MKTTENTILITGGSAGIGFEIAKAFSEKGNNVIITGRNEARLTSAAAKLKNTTAIVSDVGNKQTHTRSTSAGLRTCLAYFYNLPNKRFWQ